MVGSAAQAAVNLREWKGKYVRARNNQRVIDPFEVYLDMALAFEALAEIYERIAVDEEASDER